MATEQEYFDNEPKRRSFAQIGLIAAVLLAALALLFFFVLNGLGGTEGETTPAPAAGTAPQPEKKTTEPKAEPKKAKEETARPTRRGPVETFEVFASKDPFEPVVSEGGEGSSGDSGTGDGTGTSAGGDGANTSENVGGHTVSVVSVSEPDAGAQVQVDGTVHNVQEGERFADNFELVSTSGECADMLYGDDQFTLCEGEQILK